MTEQHAAGITDTMAAPQFSDEMNLILDIPVKMTVELGRTKMTIKELLRLSRLKRSSSLMVILVRPSSTVIFTGISRIRFISSENCGAAMVSVIPAACCSVMASPQRLSMD